MGALTSGPAGQWVRGEGRPEWAAPRPMLDCSASPRVERKNWAGSAGLISVFFLKYFSFLFQNSEFIFKIGFDSNLF